MARSALAFAMLASAGAGCSSDRAPSSAIDPSDYPAAFASAVCDSIRPCCGSAGFGFDAPACAREQAKTAGDALHATLAAGGTYDRDAAGHCVATIRRLAGTCADPLDFESALDEACNGVLSGSKKPGDACSDTIECAISPGAEVLCLHQVANGGTAGPGKCVLMRPPLPGDPCASKAALPGGPNIVGDCDIDDLDTYCDESSQLCKPRIPVGGKCAGNRCTGGAVCSNGVCVRATVGMPCDISDECDTGTYCDRASGTCATKKKTREPCAQFDSCAEGICSGGACSPGSFATRAICLGQPDTTPSGPDTEDGGFENPGPFADADAGTDGAGETDAPGLADGGADPVADASDPG